jgi:hypothetical protein
MRIRFNINPTGDVELAIIALINGYPDGLRSELVRRLIVTGFNYHYLDEDILDGINIHHFDSVSGSICKFNISQNVPLHDPVFKAFNKAKSLNSLVKPLYLNKLLKSGYLFEIGQLKSSINRSEDCIAEKEPLNGVGKESSTEQNLIKREAVVQSSVIAKPSLSLKDNPGLKNSLKNLAS